MSTRLADAGEPCRAFFCRRPGKRHARERRVSPTTRDELLRDATSVYVLDWPSRDIPDTLARSGILTTVHGGPTPEHIDVFEVGESGVVEIVKRGAPPEHADFVHSYRPAAEIADIIAAAREVGAGAVWHHTPSDEACAAVEEAGLMYFEGPDLADEVRRVRA